MGWGGISKVTDSNGTSPIAVASTGVVYTKAFAIKQGVYFGLQAIMNGTGSPNMKVELQQGASLPATEGAADAKWVIPEGMVDVFSSLADKLLHIKSLSPVPMTYARFKITGLGANPADATIDMDVFQQELIN